ncbi:MAG: hypothetical protein SH857_10705 [Chitinophagales bacterium]|mgnify:CR=1 FL=1|nr:hypothetical protein [Chitinophagales bacterium]
MTKKNLFSNSIRQLEGGIVFRLYFLLSITIFFSSCEKEPENNPPANIGNGVYITNEGPYQFGNAKVSYYDKINAVATEDLFAPANNRPLGDILQSMYIFNGKAYLVVNNSQKIEVVDPVTFVSSAIITGLGSPRYFLPINDNKAYVTDFESADGVSILDLNNNSVTGLIPLEGWTEELLLSNGKVFVTNLRSDKVYTINATTDQLEDSILVSYASVSIAEDKNGKLWTLCSGDEQKNFFGGLHRINPATLQVEQSFPFPNLTDSPWRLRMNATQDTLYFLNESVFRMAISDNLLPATAFIPQGNHNFYGIGIDPETSTVYVSDAIDFVQRGVVYSYSPDGTMLNSFYAGIIPGEFWFD